MEKVKVSKEVFEALENVQNTFDFDAIMRINCGGGFSSEKYIVLNDLSSESVAKLLILGYELEETPEEKLSKHYDVMKKHIVDPFDHGYVAGIESAIRMLGIKIKGINE